MTSWQTRFSSWLIRRRIKPRLGDMRNLSRVRRLFGQPLPAPKGADIESAAIAGVPGEWVRSTRMPSRGILLYLHGGGFIGCSPLTHRPVTVALALSGWQVFVPDYRLAPEHPFPAALNDAVAVWRALAQQFPGQRLVVAGDSAGGNLSLSLMLHEKTAGRRLPDAAALFSPSTDLTGRSPSLRTNTERDAMFHGEALAQLVIAYLQGQDPADPLVSPLLGDLRGLPPILLHVGSDEVLRDDSLRFARKAREAGVNARVQIWPDVPHVWQLLWRLPEAKRSVAQASDFLRDAQPLSASQPEELDVVIVGAGLSGIGAAAMLQQQCPDQHVALLESRDNIGGTWDLFRYPGIRSDSDMHTMGYRFRPWTETSTMAGGDAILNYVRDTAIERGIDHLVRYRHRLLAADWSDEHVRWTLTVQVSSGRDGEEDQLIRLRCRMLHLCAGYYRYDRGHRPAFAGEEDFRGTIVHPQEWPEGLDYRGKRVVVIGSGATAVTLVPELAKQAAHVTMLQRSPTYIVSLPATDKLGQWLKSALPVTLAYRLVRAKNILLDLLFYKMCRAWPEAVGAKLAREAARQAGSPELKQHFSPTYKPWDQRLCVVPDGDLFAALRAGRASVVTDQVERFTASGLRLASGQTMEADIIVTATGLELRLMGGARISVNGQQVEPASVFTYRGLMFSGVPNLLCTFGYTNASWTLRADLIAGYLCRLIRHMQKHQIDIAVPVAEKGLQPRPFIDFSSGYVTRAANGMPKQGDRKPWRLYQNYLLDLLSMRYSRIDDGVLCLLKKTAPAADKGHHGRDVLAGTSTSPQVPRQ